MGNFDSLHILPDTPLSCINLDSFLVFLFDFVSLFYTFLFLCIFIMWVISPSFFFMEEILSTNSPLHLSFNIVKMEVLFSVLALFFGRSMMVLLKGGGVFVLLIPFSSFCYAF